jgi:two-component system sensor histidine kinase GlrK
LNAGERAQIISLTDHWRGVDELARGLIRDENAQETKDAWPETVEVVARLQRDLEEIRVETQELGEWSQTAITRQFADSERAARTAARISWAVAFGTLLLGVLLSALLVRSIVRPLDRLAKGTREIAASRFAYRLDARGSDELAEVARDFNAMSERLEELDGLKRDFVSNVSHDLKTPLTSMQEANNVLLDELPGPLSESQRQLLMHNQESGRRLSSMIAKLLDLSRLESMPALNCELLDAAAVVQRAVDRANAARSKGGALVTFEAPEAPEAPGQALLLRGDADGIARVLDNVLENAIKFSPSNGAVSVTLVQHGDALTISIADEGPGIPDVDKKRIFERFYQTQTGRAVRSRGVGLGLAICRHVVAAHNGSIWVTDNVPRGSIFCVSLPGVVSVTDAATSAEPLLVESLA